MYFSPTGRQGELRLNRNPANVPGPLGEDDISEYVAGSGSGKSVILLIGTTIIDLPLVNNRNVGVHFLNLNEISAADIAVMDGVQAGDRIGFVVADTGTGRDRRATELPSPVRLAAELSATGFGSSELLVVEPPPVRLSAELTATGYGSSELAVSAPGAVRLAAEFTATGYGTSRLTIAAPGAVRLEAELMATGYGSAVLRIIEPLPVRLAAELTAQGFGSSELAIAAPGAVRLAAELTAAGFGTSELTVTAPQPVRLAAELTTTGYGSSALVVAAPVRLVVELTATGFGSSELSVIGIIPGSTDNFELGALSNDGWLGAIPILPRLVEGGGPAYLRFVRVAGTSFHFRTSSTPTSDPGDPDVPGPGDGPDLTDAWEIYDRAIRLSRSGVEDIDIKGPNHPDNADTFQDPDEPYHWTPDNGAAVSAWWTAAISANADDVRLHLDDGFVEPPSPPVRLTAELSAIGYGTSALAVTPPPPAVRLAAELTATGYGSSELAIALPVRLSAELSATGFGSSELTVSDLPPARIAAELTAEGYGSSGLMVATPLPVRLSADLMATGYGTSRLSVAESGAIRLAAELTATGYGSSELAITPPPSARVSQRKTARIPITIKKTPRSIQTTQNRRSSAQPIFSSIPKPRLTDQTLQRFVDAVAERINAEDGLNRSPTWQNLIDLGIVNEVPGGLDSVLLDNGLPFLSRPPVPTGVSFHAGIGIVVGFWDNAFAIYRNHAQTRIYRHTVDEFNNATQLGTSADISYVDQQVAHDTVYFYWIRWEAIDGTLGDPTEAFEVRTAIDPETAIIELSAQVLSDPLTQALLSPIPSIAESRRSNTILQAVDPRGVYPLTDPLKPYQMILPIARQVAETLSLLNRNIVSDVSRKGNAAASAIQTLTARVTNNDGQLISTAAAVTHLQSIAGDLDASIPYSHMATTPGDVNAAGRYAFLDIAAIDMNSLPAGTTVRTHDGLVSASALLVHDTDGGTPPPPA